MTPTHRGTEDELLRWLRRQPGVGAIGDDVAEVRLPQGVVSVDHQIEGVHFPTGLDPAVAGERLVRVNLSDLAAAGATPVAAFLALGVPAGADPRPFLTAVAGTCDEFGFTLEGGDLARSDHWTSSLTILGRRRPRRRNPHRGLGRAGDRLWIGGTLGESAVGRHLLTAKNAPRSGAARAAVGRHLRPVPQLELGDWVARRRRAAAIDVSDGLALDLHRLCRAAEVGAEVEFERLPTAPRHADLCRTVGLDPDEAILAGGEDYVLLFALPPGLRPPTALGARAIGTLTPGGAVRLRRDGRTRALPAAGWDHLGDAPSTY